MTTCCRGRLLYSSRTAGDATGSKPGAKAKVTLATTSHLDTTVTGFNYPQSLKAKRDASEPQVGSRDARSPLHLCLGSLLTAASPLPCFAGFRWSLRTAH